MPSQPEKPGNPDIVFKLTEESPPCPRCGAEALLSAKLPHGWLNNGGIQVNGTREVVLCPVCDADDPTASPLVLFFSVHGRVTFDTAEEFASLLRIWAAQTQTMRPDQAVIEAELQAWHRGELEADEAPEFGFYAPSDDRLDWEDANPDYYS